MRHLLPILLLGLLCCSYGKVLETPKGKEHRLSLGRHRIQPPPLPPVSPARLQAAKQVSGMAVVLPTRKQWITLAWNNVTNQACPERASWLHSSIYATTNFRDWTEVAHLPFLYRCQVTLSNRPATGEFYRAAAGNDSIYSQLPVPKPPSMIVSQ